MREEPWYSLLPPDLLQNAYKAKAEWAWPKQQALQVIDWLNANGYNILGVDIWIPTTPGPTIPTPFVYDWMQEPRPRRGTYPDDPRVFVENFEWDPNDKSPQGRDPVFCISADPR